jgi:hypothetical protein
MNREFHNGDPAQDRLPDRRRQAEQYLLLYDGDDLDDLVTPDFAEARVAVRVRDHRTSANTRLIAAVREFARREAPADLTLRTTGEIQRAVDSVDVYMRDQLQSLGPGGGLHLDRDGGGAAVDGVVGVVPGAEPVPHRRQLRGDGRGGHSARHREPCSSPPAPSGWWWTTPCTTSWRCGSAGSGTGPSARRCRRSCCCSRGKARRRRSLILSAGFGVLMLGHFVPVFRVRPLEPAHHGRGRGGRHVRHERPPAGHRAPPLPNPPGHPCPRRASPPI